MPIEWVVSPVEPALESIEAGLRDRTGVVLLGPAGIGKSTVASTAAERFGAAYGRVDRIVATAPAGAVPFAAVSHLIDVPDTGKTADVLRAARSSLGDGRLLVVDDAHLLDKLSAALIYQLAVGESVRLIVTVTSDHPVAEEVSALWTDGLLERIDLQPPGHDDSRLAAVIDDFVAALPTAAHRVLEYFAVDDPLTVAEVEALAGRDALDQAQASGAVLVDGSSVRPAHPLFVDAVGTALGGPDLRRLRTQLVDLLAADPADGVVARLRLAVLALDSDNPQQPDAQLAAADEALRLGDLVLAERLSRAALQRAATLPARLTVAYALAWQGRGREADAVLDEVDPAGLTETELMAWALPRAANQFWMLSEPERATAFLRATRNRVSAPTAQTTLDALSATFAMNAGNPRRARDIADEVLASPSADETAVGWAAAAAALSSARMGRFSDVDALAERALIAPGLLRFTSGFGQTTALMLTGELDRARALGQRLTDFAELQQPGRAIGEVLIADVLIAQGELDEAVRLLRRAAAVLAPTGYSWGPLAWMLLAQALGQQGATVDAGKALARAESRHGLKSMLFAPELALARAWTSWARRDAHGAIDAARDAVRSAQRGGQTAVALRALLDAVRLGDLRAVDTLPRLTDECDCTASRLALEHARGLTGRDESALSAAAERYAAAGWHGAAASAAAQSRGHR